MTYRPTMFEVANGDAIALDISLDPESKIGHTLFFKIEQDGHEIVVSLETLENLHEAAKELLRGYSEVRMNHDI